MNSNDMASMLPERCNDIKELFPNASDYDADGNISTVVLRDGLGNSANELKTKVTAFIDAKNTSNETNATLEFLVALKRLAGLLRISKNVGKITNKEHFQYTSEGIDDIISNLNTLKDKLSFETIDLSEINGLLASINKDTERLTNRIIDYFNDVHYIFGPSALKELLKKEEIKDILKLKTSNKKKLAVDNYNYYSLLFEYEWIELFSDNGFNNYQMEGKINLMTVNRQYYYNNPAFQDGYTLGGSDCPTWFSNSHYFYVLLVMLLKVFDEKGVKYNDIKDEKGQSVFDMENIRAYHHECQQGDGSTPNEHWKNLFDERFGRSLNILLERTPL